MNRSATLMDTEVSIYGLVDPRTDEVRYVGKAVDPNRRFRAHLEAGQIDRYRSHKNSWLKQLQSVGLQPRMVVLAKVSADRADDTERQFIFLYRAAGVRLTNGTDGGEGGAVTDPDAKARILAAHVGTKASDVTRKRMSESARRRCVDPVERERLRSISNGKPPIRVGERNNSAKLQEDDVREMRRLHREGVSGVELARQFGVTPQNVSYIVRRMAWQYVK